MTTISRTAMSVYPRLKKSGQPDENAYCVNVEYNEYNENRATIVMLHGYMGSIHDYDPAFVKLTEEFNLVALDLRAHGESEFPESDEVGWGVEDLAYDIMEVIKMILPEDVNFTLVGSSLSTAIALEIARTYGSRVDKLFLMSATKKFAIPGWVKIVLGIGKITPIKVLEGVVDTIGTLLTKFASEDEKEFWQDGLDKFQHITLDIHQKFIEQAMIAWEVDTTNITQPVFILAGQNDPVVPHEDSKALVEELTQGSMLSFEDAEHHIVIRKQEIVFDLIRQYMQESRSMVTQKYYTEDDLIKTAERYSLAIRQTISSPPATIQV